MLTEKLRSFITGTVKVSEAEALEWFKWQEAAVDMDMVLFESDTYKNIEPNREEIEQYFNDNNGSAGFRSPARQQCSCDPGAGQTCK